jgi:peptide/nickel transport system permease protein
VGQEARVTILRRLAALAVTVVVTPILVYGVLRGPAAGWDYAVTTFWHFDLGESQVYRQPVGEVLAFTLPADLSVLLGGLVCGLAIGVAGGVLCATRPGTWGTRAARGGAAFLMASPPYWMGFMILILFSPGTGRLLEVPFLSGLAEYVPITDNPFRWAKSLWVPWLMVGLPLAAAVLRMTESALRDVLEEDLMRVARAKGLTERVVIRRHALPIAMIPVAALTAANLAVLVMNTALMEYAFNIPGTYREIQSIASNADWPLLMGMVIETTAFVVVANMLADAFQARLDPTVQRA